jgi:hypothetical protein
MHVGAEIRVSDRWLGKVHLTLGRRWPRASRGGGDRRAWRQTAARRLGTAGPRSRRPLTAGPPQWSRSHQRPRRAPGRRSVLVTARS